MYMNIEKFLSNIQSPYVIWLYVGIMIWSFIWKGLALWKSARLGSKVWFVLILVVNTLGLLEIAYIFILHRINFKKILRFGKLSLLLSSFKKGKIKE